MHPMLNWGFKERRAKINGKYVHAIHVKFQNLFIDLHWWNTFISKRHVVGNLLEHIYHMYLLLCIEHQADYKLL